MEPLDHAVSFWVVCRRPLRLDTQLLAESRLQVRCERGASIRRDLVGDAEPRHPLF